MQEYVGAGLGMDTTPRGVKRWWGIASILVSSKAAHRAKNELCERHGIGKTHRGRGGSRELRAVREMSCPSRSELTDRIPKRQAGVGHTRHWSQVEGEERQARDPGLDVCCARQVIRATEEGRVPTSTCVCLAGVLRLDHMGRTGRRTASAGAYTPPSHLPTPRRNTKNTAQVAWLL